MTFFRVENIKKCRKVASNESSDTDEYTVFEYSFVNAKINLFSLIYVIISLGFLIISLIRFNS